MENLKTYAPDDLKHLQQLELKILKEVISICESHNLKYYAYGGTALGAIRHNGFIPWDDDVDISMFREDYEKLLKILDAELSEEFYVMHFYKQKDFVEPFAKVCLKGTSFKLQTFPFPSNPGIFIDIFPMDNVPESKIKRTINYHMYSILSHMPINTVFNVKTENKFNSFIHSLIHHILKIFPGRKGAVNALNACLTRYRGEKTNLVTVHFSRTDGLNFGKNGFFDKRDFEPSIKVKFEDIEINVPKNYDKVLTTYYGDYMTLPPKEKRYNHTPEELDFGKY